MKIIRAHIQTCIQKNLITSIQEPASLVPGTTQRTVEKKSSLATLFKLFKHDQRKDKKAVPGIEEKKDQSPQTKLH